MLAIIKRTDNISKLEQKDINDDTNLGIIFMYLLNKNFAPNEVSKSDIKFHL